MDPLNQIEGQETWVVNHPPADIAARKEPSEETGMDHRMLDEGTFHHTICLERKRAERSRRSFLLVLLDLRTVLANDSNERILHTILSSLWRATRETDVAGWHKSGAVLGIMFMDVP